MRGFAITVCSVAAFCAWAGSASAQVDMPVFSIWATEVTSSFGGPDKLNGVPTQHVPNTVLLPGDIIRVELFISNWDVRPNRGRCDGDPAQNQNLDCSGIGVPNACAGKHCLGVGNHCTNTGDCLGVPCVDNACKPFPRIGALQAVVVPESFQAGPGATGSLSLFPVPCDQDSCLDIGDQTCACAHFYEFPFQCSCANSVCDAQGICGVGSSILLERARSDYLFLNKGTVEGGTYGPFSVSFEGRIEEVLVLQNPELDGIIDNQAPKYLGTLLIQASPDASGSFAIRYLKDSNFTLLNDTQSSLIGTSVFEDLILDFPIDQSECSTILAASPVNCEVDGRQPHDIGSTLPAQGITSVDVTLSSPCNAANLTSGTFTVSLDPPGGTPPAISVSGSGNVATVTFSPPIPPQKWTCLTRTAPGTGQVCLGFLPGDVNGNLTANTADVTAAVNSLTGMTPEPLIGTDTNRSAIHTAEDLVRLLDLFNAGGAYVPGHLNSTLGACPSGGP